MFHQAKDRSFTGLDEREWSGPWMFIQLADTQFGMLRSSMQKEVKMAKLAVKHINRLKPKFVIVCGNLINEFPRTAGKRCANTKKADEQTAIFKSVMSGVDPQIPLVCLCGNHDVGDNPNRASIQLYKSRFGDDYLQFWAGGSQCIVINSSLISAPEKLHNSDEGDITELAAEQYDWMGNVLATRVDPAMIEASDGSARDAHPPVFAFSHKPPFIFDPNEPKGYFNLEPNVRAPLLQKFKDAGVSKLFCGHYHRNAGGWDESLEVVVTAALCCAFKTRHEPTTQQRLDISGIDMTGLRCSQQMSGLRCVCITQDRQVQHKFFTLDSVPLAIDPSGLGRGWPNMQPLDTCGSCTTSQIAVETVSSLDVSDPLANLSLGTYELSCSDEESVPELPLSPSVWKVKKAYTDDAGNQNIETVFDSCGWAGIEVKGAAESFVLGDDIAEHADEHTESNRENIEAMYESSWYS